jgi:hypothetical protein
MTAPQHFHLPVNVLVETLRGWHGTVVVRTHIPGLAEVWTGVCLVEMVLVQGVVCSCTISTAQGQPLLHQEAAFHAVRSLGALEWTLSSSASSVPLPPASVQEGNDQPVSAANRVPHRTQAALSPGLLDGLDGLSRRHKQVLLLIDGHKNCQEIARLLTMDPQEVEAILHLLHQHQLINHKE